jgi:putative FmdB family regulatory protein
MPIYSYACGKCDHADDEYLKMDSAAPVINCPKCGALEYVKQVSMVGTDMDENRKPQELYSVACNSMEEIRAMQAAGVPCSDDPNDELFGVPVARSRKQKLAAYKVAGFVEAK